MSNYRVSRCRAVVIYYIPYCIGTIDRNHRFEDDRIGYRLYWMLLKSQERKDCGQIVSAAVNLVEN